MMERKSCGLLRTFFVGCGLYVCYNRVNFGSSIKVYFSPEKCNDVI